MWFVAGVGSAVNGQGATLDESLLAWLVVTRVGPLVGMYPIVPLQIRLAVEALSTETSRSACCGSGIEGCRCSDGMGEGIEQGMHYLCAAFTPLTLERTR